MRVAVTGANGRLGGQVVELLAAGGDRRVVAVSRRELRLDPQAPNVTGRVADYMDLAALRVALRDVDTLVFVSSDGAATQVVLHHQNVVRAAADAGVTHIVALSGLDADPVSPFCYAVTNGYTEQILHESGCSVSIARASLFTEFFMQWLPRVSTGGQIRVPAADGRISLVSRSDVGRCLAALAVAGPTGRHHNITGPESLDLAAIAAITEREWETPTRYHDLTPAEYCTEMASTNLDPWWIYAFSTMFDSVRQQRWAITSEEVSLLAGQASTSFAEVLNQHKYSK